MHLHDLTSPAVRDLDLASRIVVLPLGAFEQHGPHLPLTTDTDLVTAVAKALEAARPSLVLCLPTLWAGHSTHHLRFPGTLSIQQMPYISLLIELCASIHAMGATKVFLLNGHGGNDVPARAALREIKTRFPELTVTFASYWTLAAKTIKEVRESELGGLGHACEFETSLMLHLHPEKVNMSLARRDGSRHTDVYRKNDMQYGRPVYFVSEFHENTESGVMGHPELATAEKGRRFFEGIVADATNFLDAYAQWSPAETS